MVLSVLLGCCSLALDIGFLELKQVQLQNAADAAALGAIYQMERQDTSTSPAAIANYTAAAVAEAGQNGFVNNTNGIKVVVNMPPTSGLYANNLAAVQVLVSQPVSTVFQPLSYTIVARATGVVPPCVYFMSSNTSYYTLKIVNNTHVNIGCAGYARWSGYSDGGTLASFNALYVGGPYAASSFSGTVAAGSQGYFPTFGAPAQSDPLSYLVSPAPPANNAACDPTLQNKTISSGIATLSPGIYCGNFTISGNGTTQVVLNPGVYTIAGSANWSGATISGTGVTLFLTKIGSSSNYGTFSVGTNSNLSLTAPTSGPLAAVVLFGDRNWVTSSTALPPQDVSFNGATLNMDGIVYLTNTGMSFANGTLTSPNYFGLVVDTFTLSGATFTIKGNYSGVSGASPYRPGVGLAE